MQDNPEDLWLFATLKVKPEKLKTCVAAMQHEAAGSRSEPEISVHSGISRQRRISASGAGVRRCNFLVPAALAGLVRWKQA